MNREKIFAVMIVVYLTAVTPIVVLKSETVGELLIGILTLIACTAALMVIPLGFAEFKKQLKSDED